jgi:hypothetical protein
MNFSFFSQNKKKETVQKKKAIYYKNELEWVI